MIAEKLIEKVKNRGAFLAVFEGELRGKNLGIVNFV